MFICSRQRNKYWCRAGLSPRCLFAAGKGANTGVELVSLQDVYLQQEKEQVLV
jgi:hypothetical protein